MIYRLTNDFTTDDNGARIPTPPMAPERPETELKNALFIPEDWTDEPSGARVGNPYEWRSVSLLDIATGEWGPFGDPTLYGTHPTGVGAGERGARRRR